MDQSEAYYFSRGRTNTRTQALTELWHWMTFMNLWLKRKGSRMLEWLKGAPSLCFFNLLWLLKIFCSQQEGTTARRINNIQHILQLSFFFFFFWKACLFVQNWLSTRRSKDKNVKKKKAAQDIEKVSFKASCETCADRGWGIYGFSDVYLLEYNWGISVTPSNHGYNRACLCLYIYIYVWSMTSFGHRGTNYLFQNRWIVKPVSFAHAGVHL